jgi:thiamine biosynthesis lipoprotein
MRGARIVSAAESPRTLRAMARSTVAMDTVVTATVVSARAEVEVEQALERALAWFGVVERACSRFDPGSELVRLCRRPGVAVPVGPLLFEALGLALQVAEASGGAFDPTIGAALRESRVNVPLMMTC